MKTIIAFWGYLLVFGMNIMSQCEKVISSVEDPGPAQMTGASLPIEVDEMEWFFPADYTRMVSFGGNAGYKASHEGVDYVHEDQGVEHVYVYAAGAGEVVYVREGCPESSLFSHNNFNRECGAGWGNHVVVKHGSVYTRYAHLRHSSIKVKVGDVLQGEQLIAEMGNSGRSELRHLHFEVGMKNEDFEPCAMSQNFDYVHNPARLKYKQRTGIDKELADDTAKVVVCQDQTNEIIKVKMPVSHSLGRLKCIELFDASGRKIEELNVSEADNNSEVQIPYSSNSQLIICRITTEKICFSRKLVS
jgi:hypothetical protein